MMLHHNITLMMVSFSCVALETGEILTQDFDIQGLGLGGCQQGYLCEEDGMSLVLRSPLNRHEHIQTRDKVGW
jgi:hypothetical protein